MNAETNLYFQNKRIREHLIKAGLIDQNGTILPPSNSRKISKSARSKSHSRQEKTNLPVEATDSTSSLRKSRRDLSLSEREDKFQSISRAKSARVQKKSQQQSLTTDESKSSAQKCCFIFIYNGLNEQNSIDTKRRKHKSDEIQVIQRTDEGKNLTLFHDFLKAKEIFSFYSRRFHNPPFQILIKINGTIEERLNIRSESRPHRRPPIGGRFGTFTIFSVQRTVPGKNLEKENFLQRTIKKTEKKKSKKSDPPLFVEEPKRYDKSAFVSTLIDPSMTKSEIFFSPILTRTPSARSLDKAISFDRKIGSPIEENSLTSTERNSTRRSIDDRREDDFFQPSDDQKPETSHENEEIERPKSPVILSRRKSSSSSSSSSSSTIIERFSTREKNEQSQETINGASTISNFSNENFVRDKTDVQTEEKVRAPSPRSELLRKLWSDDEPKVPPQTRPVQRPIDAEFEKLFSNSNGNTNTSTEKTVTTKQQNDNSFWDTRPPVQNSDRRAQNYSRRNADDSFLSLFGEN